MALFIDVLKEKFKPEDEKEDKTKEKEKKEKKFEIKKSGLFTGIKSSQTYEKNNIKHIVKHSLNKNKKLLESSLSKLIKESYLFFENENSSVVYRRNIKTPQGTNKLAFPHTAVAKTISKETPNKPRDGIGVSTIFNRTTLYNKHIQDLKTIPKLFNNSNNSNNPENKG